MADVRDGVVSPGAAKAQYGVVIADDAVDVRATSALRQAHTDSPSGQFDRGVARAAHEAIFTPAVADALAELLFTLPSGMRYFAKGKLFSRIRALAVAGETVTPAIVRGLMSELMAALGMPPASCPR